MNDFSNSTAFSALSLGGPHARQDADGQMPLFRRYLLIAFRWRKVILATVAGFLIAGLVITLWMTPQYTATATIEIARESNRIVQIQGVEREASEGDLEFYQTQYGLLRSRVLAERIAAQLKLDDDPAFFEMFDYEVKGSPLPGANGRYPVEGRDARRRAAGSILLRYVTIDPIRLSRLVTISFTSPDATLSARIVNSWTAAFVSTTLERRYEATSYARKFLEDRLGQLRQRLEDTERQLVTYASKQRIINLPPVAANGAERSMVAENLADLNAEFAQATADRIKAGSKLNSNGNGAVAEALQNTAISGLRQRQAELSADYKKLLVQFEPDYPAAKALKSQIDQLDSAIKREENRVFSSFENSYRDSLQRERQLSARVEGLKNSMLDLRRRSIQYNIYQREVDTNRQLYDALLQRYKEVGVAGGVGVNNISVVDSADVPQFPSSPRLIINLVLALIAGMGASAVLTFILEQSDEAISDPSELEPELDIPLLGAIPKTAEGTPAEALTDRKSPIVEAYLSIQTNLRFTTDQGVPRSLAVTSTRPGEGKSTSSLALASLLVRAGKRVILIDGDMRSPSLHRVLGLPNDRGLSDYLSGSDDYETLVRHAETFNLDVITSGLLPPNAAELLTGDRLGVLVKVLQTRFDHVIIDSPPVMGLADAPLIGSRVDGVVFAVQSHSTRSSLVRTALGRLKSANVRVFGGVLTKFESKRAGYGYDYGYGYGHGDSASTKI